MVDTKYKTVNGVKVNLIERGKGQPVVLIHGLSTCYYTWRNNIDDLSKSFRVIILDLPGFGFSDRALTFNYSFDGFVCFLNDLFQVAGIKQAHLVGHSFGASLCTYFAEKFTDNVLSLVLIAPSLRMDWSVYSNPKILSNLILLSYSNKSLITDEMISLYKTINSIEGTNLVLGRILQGIGKHKKSKHQEKQLNTKCMIVWGRDDRIFPYERAYEAAIDFEDVTCHIVNECGHAPHEEKAHIFNRLVEDFIHAQDA